MSPKPTQWQLQGVVVAKSNLSSGHAKLLRPHSNLTANNDRVASKTLVTLVGWQLQGVMLPNILGILIIHELKKKPVIPMNQPFRNAASDTAYERAD